MSIMPAIHIGGFTRALILIKGRSLCAAYAGTPLFWVVLLAPIAVVLLLGSTAGRMSIMAAQVTFWVYAGLNGFWLAGIFIVYTGSSIAGTFFAAAATFGVISMAGYVTRIDLTHAGPLLLMGWSASSLPI